MKNKLTEEIADRVRLASNRIDNCLAARTFMLADFLEKREPQILTEVRDELRAIVREVTGKDAWA